MNRFPWLWVIRAGVGLLFVVSGYMKLIEPYQNFLAVIYDYQFVTGWAARGMAMAVPWAELVFGVFLLAGLWVRLSAGALWILNTAFIGVIGSALIRKLPVKDCGCFGHSAVSLSLEKALALDGALWLIFLFLFIIEYHAAPQRRGFRFLFLK